MMKKIARKTIKIARGMALTLGVAVMVALVLGVATTALAGTGVGARFQLGQTNTVNAITKLVGSVAGPGLQVDNNSTNANATALDLQVEPGKAPMKVNSEAKVANLNSDKLDNLDASAFVRSTYSKSNATDGGGGATTGGSVACDTVDLALSGGYFNVDSGTDVISDSPGFANNTPGWQLIWRNDATPDTVTVVVLCADIGTPHQ